MSEESSSGLKVTAIENIPVLPLRDVVVYPHMVIPLFVGREKSIVALDLAMKSDKRILLVAQKQADVDDPGPQDLYRLGTVATILQLLKLPDGTVKVLVEGSQRARISTIDDNGNHFVCELEPIAIDSRSSPEMAEKIRSHRHAGRYVRDWEDEGVDGDPAAADSF